MRKNPSTALDFDAAMQLAQTDPEAFEQYRRDAIEALIARAPERSQTQLRRLQWRIDQERKRASNPVAACVKLYQMMWESFAGESGLIDTIRNAHTADGCMPPKAKILAFSRAGTRQRAIE